MAQSDDFTVAPIDESADFADEDTQADLAALQRLEVHANSIGLKCSLDPDPLLPVLTIEMRNGKDFRKIYIASEDAADSLSAMPLDKYSFLGQYSAVACYEEGWLEAAIVNLDSGVPRHVLRRRLFGAAASSQPESRAIACDSPLSISLSESAQFLGHITGSTRLFLRISGIAVKQHDAALNLLRDLSNSLFMQLDLRIEISLGLGRDRPSSRRRKGTSDNLGDQALTMPRFSYDDNAAALYWYGRSARSLPLLQFLAFYQCVEVFFPHYSRVETIGRMRNYLKNPTFDDNRDTDINGLMNIASGNTAFGVSEKLQLRAVVAACVTSDEVRQFLHEDEDRKKFFENNFKEVSKVRISLRDDGDVINQAAERIYDIRCKVVHTKNSDTVGEPDVILPYSREADILVDDIELLRFIARKVLIASGRTLEIKTLERAAIPEEKAAT